MTKAVAVQGCTLELTDPTLTAAPPQITTSPSTTTKAGGSAAYSGDLTVQVGPVTDASGNVAPVFTLTISGSSQKLKIDGKPAVREEDSGTAYAVTFTHPSSGATATHDVEVKITNAGQNKAKME